jgi:hypothetical protein
MPPCNGTGQLHGVAGNLAGSANGAASGAGSATGSLNGFAGNLAGTATGAGSATGSLNSVPATLAAAGSAAASGTGAFAVTPGMPVLGADGDKIGQVRQLVTDQRGQVQALLVEANGARALIPAGNFTADGSALVSAMGQGQLQQAAAQQQPAPPAP